MKGNAPNCSATGSQIERPRKPNPNFSNGSLELRAISIIIRAARPAIKTANKPVVHLNNGSPIRGRALTRESVPEGTADLLGLKGGGEPGLFPASVDSIMNA